MYVMGPGNPTARQPLTAAAAAGATRQPRLTGNSLRCFAKGNQKNEGMYFEYVDSNKAKQPSPGEQQSCIRH
jgi:hypothetical protein